MEQSKFYQIKNITEHEYTLVGCDGSVITCPIQDVHKSASAFTIQDAKDGDVLATSTGAFIYNGNNGGGSCPGCYCGINTLGNFKTGVETHWTGGKVYPATKEQRGLLFQKMKEAGYEWDAEKKILKEIENEIEIPFGAKDSELQEATYYIPKGFHAEIDNDKVVIKKGEKPAEWSEEDERMYRGLHNLIYSTPCCDSRKEFSDWLNSLRLRIMRLK